MAKFGPGNRTFTERNSYRAPSKLQAMIPDLEWPKECKVIKNDATQVVIHPHGATVLSWKVDGQELLFCSKLAVLDGTKAIRGGIPLVFPQFGTGPIMAGQHGFARTMPWSINVADNGQSAICQLTPNDKTLAAWPHKFKLTYTVSLEDKDLKTTLQVQNADDLPFEFTALLHTYFGVPDIIKAKVKGLHGLQYADKLDGSRLHKENREEITIDGEVDRNYMPFPHEAILEYPGARLTLITDSGLPDLVLWNPWIEKANALADFDDEEYKQMVCLESGKIMSPIKLEPNQIWAGSQTLSVTFD